jgi:CDP-diglyceride synthetase
MSVRPLGLPVGSVRALLLLALGARAILDLRAAHAIAPWLVVAVLLAAASYFAARSSMRSGGEKPGRAPLGLPAGTVRLLFLALVAYGTWLYFRHHEIDVGSAPAVWVMGAYVVGLVVGLVVNRRRTPADAGATFWDHLLALVTLVAAAGLVWLARSGDTPPPTWVAPLLGAIVVHYFAAR